VNVSPDVCQTVYNASNDYAWYRATIQDGQLIIESAYETQPSVGFILSNCFNISSKTTPFDNQIQLRCQKYGKIYCENDSARRALIFQLTERCNIYSLGRFATWRQVLLDDVVKDIRQIDNMIHSSPYQRQLQSIK
jgi:hypothetical protein